MPHTDIPANFAILTAALVGVFAVLFLFAPQKGLSLTQHHPEHLTTIMAGRYLFMAAVTLWAAFHADTETLTGLFVLLGAVGAFDAVTYLRAGTNPWPHALAAIAAWVAAGLTWVMRSGVAIAP